jgi:hypothetical protein
MNKLCTKDSVHWVYMRCTFWHGLYTLYIMYTVVCPWVVVYRKQRVYRKYIINRGKCTFSRIILPIIRAPVEMYTLYKMYTHFFLHIGAHVCALCSRSLCIIYATFSRILCAMQNIPQPRSLDFLVQLSFRDPFSRKKRGLATPLDPQSPGLSQCFCDPCDLPAWPFLPHRGIAIQLPTDLNIGPSPCEQPPKMLHPLIITNTMRSTEPQKLVHRTHLHPVERRPQNQLIEMPPQTMNPPGVCTGHKFDRCIPRKIRLDTKRFAMRVQLNRPPGYMRLRRNRDRWIFYHRPLIRPLIRLNHYTTPSLYTGTHHTGSIASPGYLRHTQADVRGKSIPCQSTVADMLVHFLDHCQDIAFSLFRFPLYSPSLCYILPLRSCPLQLRVTHR